MTLRWMDYSGAPALLLPRASLADWHGMMLTTPDPPATSPDFVGPDGVAWFVHGEMDFANPVTHYDHLCAAFGGDGYVEERVITVGTASAFAVSRSGEDAVAWWDRRTALLTGHERTPDSSAWESAAWTPCAEIEVCAPDLVLMNSAMHGAQVLAGGDSEFDAVVLAPGRYRIEAARFDDVTSAYRFVR